MRKALLVVISLLLTTGMALLAKPARPGALRHIQPDGSVISLRMQGDEWGHYATDLSGHVLEPDAQGFYRLSHTSEADAARWCASLRRQAARHIKRLGAATRGVPVNMTVPVVLIAFQDIPFSVQQARQQFQDMLNLPGYAQGGSTGSVRDYYLQNSGGAIDFTFEVLEPVRLEKNVSAYGKDILQSGVRVGDTAPELALAEACQLLDSQVDFSRYDANADGVIDLILYFFAGYDQAEGGKGDTIWSHAWDVRESDNDEARATTLDGCRLGRYICSSELQGSAGTVMSGIGSTCHELGHTVGLPDFYDTSGPDDGLAAGLYSFSTMSTGFYNNNTHTPPHFNMVERQLLGLVQEIPLLPEADGWVSLSPVQENAAYMVLTGTDGEFFLYEYRNGKGWDAPLPEGLLVYHVDQSLREVGEHTARSLWEQWEESNAINANAQHPCFYLVPSARQDLLELTSLEAGKIVYPGLNGVRCQEGVDWDGNYTGWQITNLQCSGGQMQLMVQHGAGANINGFVTTPQGEALADVSIQSNAQKAVSNPLGYYRLDLPDAAAGTVVSILASKPGYRSRRLEVPVSPGRVACVPLVLRQEGEGDQSLLSKFNQSAKKGYYPSAGIGAVRFSPRELWPYAGQELSQIIFYPWMTDAFSGEVYVTVDVGSRRVLTRKVDSIQKGKYIQHTVDIADAHIVLPEGLPVYLGYGSPDGGESFALGTVYPVQPGNGFVSPFSLQESRWEELYVSRAGYYMDVMVQAQVSEQQNPSGLEDMGYCWIDPGKGDWKEGEELTLQVHGAKGMSINTIRWQMDGRGVLSSTVTLQGGEHTLEALLTYADGREETLLLQLSVKE